MTRKDLVEISVLGILAWLVVLGGGYAIWQAVK